MVENGRPKILWDFQIWNDKLMMAYQLNTVVVVDKLIDVIVIDVAIPSSRRRNTRSLKNAKG